MNANTKTAIYTAIRSFAAAEKAKGNGWAELAGAVALLSAAEAEGYCDEASEDFKRNNKTGQTPGAFRTAKSVALKALRLGVSLLDADGKVIGKTAIEKACKEAQEKIDAAELARIEGSETEAGELVEATADELCSRIAALLIAAKDMGYNMRDLADAAISRAEQV